jgi:hypothetical protein
MRLLDNGVAKGIRLHCSNNTGGTQKIERTNGDWIFSDCNIISNTMADSDHALISFIGGSNFTIVGRVIKGNADPTGKIFSEGGEASKF